MAFASCSDVQAWESFGVEKAKKKKKKKKKNYTPFKIIKSGQIRLNLQQFEILNIDEIQTEDSHPPGFD